MALARVPLLAVLPWSQARSFTCIMNRECTITLAEADPGDWAITVPADRPCPTCTFNEQYGPCPWLNKTTGVELLVRCEDGTLVDDWTCNAHGHGGRLLCPPNFVMCQAVACGKDMDNCCDPETLASDPYALKPCSTQEGLRKCSWISVNEGRNITININHGPSAAGNFRLCRCSQAMVNDNVISEDIDLHVHMVGPSGGGVTTCISGDNNYIACYPLVEGLKQNNLEDSLVIVTDSGSCDNVSSALDGFTGSYNPVYGMVLLDGGQRHEMAKAVPGVYAVCWCLNDTADACTSLSSFNRQVRTLTWRGPYRIADFTATLGTELSFPVPGLMMAPTSKIRLKRFCGDNSEASVEGTIVKGVAMFPTVVEDRARNGWWNLCWCQETLNGQMSCNFETDYVTHVGRVFLRCPDNFFGSGDFSPCRPCLRVWLQSNSSGDGCVLNAHMAWMALATILLWTAAATVLLTQFDIISWPGHGLKLTSAIHRVEDITEKNTATGEKQVSVTTTKASRKDHGFRSVQPIPVIFHDTGHYLLDRKPSPMGKCLYLLKVESAVSLTLLDAEAQHVKGIESSSGYFVIPARYALVCSDVIPGVNALFTSVILLALGAVTWLGRSLQIDFVGMSAEACYEFIGSIAAALIARKLLRLRKDQGSLAHKVRNHRGVLKQINPVIKPITRGPQRAISAYSLFHLQEDFREFILRRNLYYLDFNIVRPLCEPYQLSYAEVVGALQVQWFVSHFWGTAFSYTAEALRKHALMVQGQTGDSWESVAFWFCLFSNNQFKLQEELGDYHSNSSFNLALHCDTVQGTCMVLDVSALPLTRSWCLFELLQTMLLEKQRSDFQGLHFCTNTGVLNLGQSQAEVAISIGEKLASLRLENASATFEQDKEMIGMLVLQMMGSFEEINGLLRQRIYHALQACKDHVDEDFETILHSLHDSIGLQDSVQTVRTKMRL
eukprot:TRINITY_DN12227_c0_g1_i1.p1 TRINITY_DN12227_c0_g1~~TRINITY_DN12227_c0_g1_i1.p1  ORF type:complete len:950 (+),score=89.42 TRINITY_DN12227_c0_g1_i1:73-2922(+)